MYYRDAPLVEEVGDIAGEVPREGKGSDNTAANPLISKPVNISCEGVFPELHALGLIEEDAEPSGCVLCIAVSETPPVVMEDITTTPTYHIDQVPARGDVSPAVLLPVGGLLGRDGPRESDGNDLVRVPRSAVSLLLESRRRDCDVLCPY